MLGRNYPIMFGLGTKIVTSYHYPSFKTGLMIAICDSKKKLEKRPLTDKEFREAYNGIIKELYFDEPNTLKRFIDQLNTIHEDWLKEIEKDN